MCGIVGFVSKVDLQAALASGRFRAAIESIRHRGPDAEGEYADDNLWLGHVRLSILDLSESGRQPMATASGRFVICYNGEVYNYRELASDLALKNLRGHSDTEVVIRAWEQLGVDLLPKLNGMFAFAIYDREAKKLWLVRDRLGIKPLYYLLDGRGLGFASEIKGIAALSDSEALRCDINSLHEWLYFGNSLGGRTLYHGIKQLLPGHYLELDLTSFQCRIGEYWSLPAQASRAREALHKKEEIISETRRLLEAAVKRQLVSDVPVGLFLSGGVDSSVIAAFASRHYNGRLATYSAGFDFSPEGCELPKARAMATLYGTDHHEIHISGRDVGSLVEKMVYHHDLPFSDAANLPLYLMAAQISAHTKVVLQGDGGDELFGGYRRYATLKYYHWLNLIARRGSRIPGLMGQSDLQYRVSRYLDAYAAKNLATTMALLLTYENVSTRPAGVFSPRLQEMIEQSDPFARYRHCQPFFAGHDPSNQMSLVDLMVQLPDIFLEKVDRATMAASLEVRVPFLDNDLVDYIVRVPGNRKLPWGRKKWLLKQAMKGIVPDKILYGPKTGFNVPFGHWLKTSLKPLFFDHLAKFKHDQPGVLNEPTVHKWYTQSENGQRDYSFMLWKVLNLMVWCNNARVSIEL